MKQQIGRLGLSPSNWKRILLKYKHTESCPYKDATQLSYIQIPNLIQN